MSTQNLILPTEAPKPRKRLEVFNLVENPVQVVMQHCNCPDCGEGELVNTGEVWGDNVLHDCNACGAKFTIKGRGFPFINFMEMHEEGFVPSDKTFDDFKPEA